MFVIGVAGFGQEISWQDDLVVPPGHKMSFKVSDAAVRPCSYFHTLACC